MKTDGHDWLVLHHVRFGSAVDGAGRPFPAPKGAEAWRFYPAALSGPNGLRTATSDEWGGFGLYTTREAAEDVYANPEAHLPFLGQAVEAFHALVVPFAHRGEVNWRGEVRANSTFATCPKDPGGPLVVITSAGYTNPGPEDLPRIMKFSLAIDDVLAYYGTLPGNIRRQSFTAHMVDGGDGMTISLWRDDAAMMAAAYKPGIHRTELDYQRDHGHFDRSSSSRGRIVAHKGAWGGSDPVLQMA